MSDSALERLRACLLPSGVPDRLQGVELEQRGAMWMQPGGRALPFHAAQWMQATRVAYCWRARARLGLLPIRVVDAFEQGRGRLDVRLLGLVPVARARGPEVDRGEAARYLAEVPWVPHALVRNPELELRSIDVRRVEIACRVQDERVAVELEIDPSGIPLRARMDARPRAIGKRFVETPWHVTYGPLERHDGVCVPGSGEAAWTLPDGAFTYWRGRIEAYRHSPAKPGITG